MASPDDLERANAIQRYRELMAEKETLAKSIKWVRSQLQVEDTAEHAVGSDLLFLADYSCKERHVQVKVGNGPGLNGTWTTPVLDLTVQQRMEKMSTVLWPSSCVLAEVVTHELGDLCRRGAAILELGCGTAVPSIVAASLGAHVLATDAEIASADGVIAQNQHALGAAGGSIETVCLHWGAPSPDRPWAAVLVADALYDEAGHAGLAATLASAAEVALKHGASIAPRMLVAFQNRRPQVESRFFCQALPAVGLQWKELPLTSIPLSDNLRSCIRVMEVTLKDTSEAAAVESVTQSLDGLAL